ncbi:PEP-CTERM sorting domain-containing protein [Piscinibacter sp.]|uniref:PEP-CTERM sorting domain-containing protein n=1 Tax=Piscinibacter sp. TaxID=1903157 RepID=UPI002B94F6FD|nr:PEP-CTERM sorting domain-containing protein [Albitalea sp.]HUG25630.1 PEP-CTERM sorting domain-containing protein [Albitalea sp.]
MKRLSKWTAVAALCAFSGAASADLTAAGTWTGNVGLSVDGIGSNLTPVGDVQAFVPVGATILQAYLYSAGTPSPWYPDSPTTLADYNGAGITLAGNIVSNFDTLVGAVSTRADIGAWYTARADVTTLVQSLTAGAVTDSFSWGVTEGSLNSRIDGQVLAIVYEHASLGLGSVALLDGGQNTGGETTFVQLGSPLTDPTDPSFAAQLGLGISFSCCGQSSTIQVNGSMLTDTAGNFNDGLQASDGSLITVGGIGDDPSNNVGYDMDDELYDLSPFLAEGDMSFSIFTQNPTNDDNIFFASLYLTGEITDIRPGIPEPQTYALMLAGLALIGAVARRRRG